MYKIFCDICGTEITDYAGSRMKGESGRLSVEVIVAIDKVWNGGHACVSCIRKALEQADIKRKGTAPERELQEKGGTTPSGE